MWKKETENKGKIKKKRNCKCKWIKKWRGKEKENRTGKLIGRQREKIKERKEKCMKANSQLGLGNNMRFSGGEYKRLLVISLVDIFDQNIGWHSSPSWGNLTFSHFSWKMPTGCTFVLPIESFSWQEEKKLCHAAKVIRAIRSNIYPCYLMLYSKQQRSNSRRRYCSVCG